MPENFNKFDDNTLCTTISLAEYRYLVEQHTLAQARAERVLSDNEVLSRRVEDLAMQILMLQEKLEGADDADET